MKNKDAATARYVGLVQMARLQGYLQDYKHSLAPEFDAIRLALGEDSWNTLTEPSKKDAVFQALLSLNRITGLILLVSAPTTKPSAIQDAQNILWTRLVNKATELGIEGVPSLDKDDQ